MGIEPEQPEQLDTSEDLDLVQAFYSAEHDAQMKAELVRGLLESAGVPAVIVEGAAMPNLPAEVRVPKARLEDALRLIAESEAAGPGAADAAERLTEDPA
ncbi:MAG: DUF2007 domain-containing protein [Bryobacterales bacterium]|nr:DUF2007 domain-containing protein [Bryobacterales bacterium]